MLDIPLKVNETQIDRSDFYFWEYEHLYKENFNFWKDWYIIIWVKIKNFENIEGMAIKISYRNA